MTTKVLSPEEIDALLNPPKPVADVTRQPTGRVADVVVRYFDIKQDFHCNVRPEGVRCNKRTQLLFLGSPCCEDHVVGKLQELLDSPSPVGGMLYGNSNEERD